MVATRACPPLPDEIWFVILGMLSSGAYGGIRVRGIAQVGRVFARAWWTHEDRTPPPAASTLVHFVPHAATEADDYRCCECGRWWHASEPLSEVVTDPWGHALMYSTVRLARNWIANTAVPLNIEWSWHPVQIETYQDMIAVVEQWPGDVCGDCWEQWDGEGVSLFDGWPWESAAGGEE